MFICLKLTRRNDIGQNQTNSAKIGVNYSALLGSHTVALEPTLSFRLNTIQRTHLVLRSNHPKSMLHFLTQQNKELKLRRWSPKYRSVTTPSLLL